ncbi:MAG: hypothetical protein ACOYLQ_16765 [Hyphomicrobiaceae bacterium]|jgi:hypothetical protein
MRAEQHDPSARVRGSLHLDDKTAEQAEDVSLGKLLAGAILLSIPASLAAARSSALPG